MTRTIGKLTALKINRLSQSGMYLTVVSCTCRLLARRKAGFFAIRGPAGTGKWAWGRGPRCFWLMLDQRQTVAGNFWAEASIPL